MRVADIIAQLLIENGITTLFSVTGGGAMHLNNAFGIRNDLSVYYNLHEQGCSMAAEGYARMTGKPAAVCVTSGPGGTNAITGVMGAYQDNVPMLVISGQVRYDTTIQHLGLPVRQYGEQEFDIIGAVGGLTKYAVMVTDPSEIRYQVEKAIHLATTGRRGPCWLDIPLNVQNAQVEFSELRGFEPASADSLNPAEASEVSEVLSLLDGAKCPAILAGTAIRSTNSTELFRRLATKLHVPVVTAQAAPDSMFHGHPCYFGTSGASGSRGGNFILQNCDVLLVLGCRLGFKQTGFNFENFAPNAKIIMVDIDPAELEKPNLRLYKRVQCDLPEFLSSMLELSGDRADSYLARWHDYCRTVRDRYPICDPAHSPSGKFTNSYYFYDKLRTALPENAIIVLGNSGTAIAPSIQCAPDQPEQRIIVNIDCGAMGDDIPLALGACIGNSKKPVIMITGDGSFQLNIHELQVVSFHKLPIKMIVFNNGGYRSIYQTHKNFFGGMLAGCTPDSGLSFPPFDKIADAYGLAFKRCENDTQIVKAISWLMSETGPLLLEVIQDPDQSVMPRQMSRLREDGTFETPPLDDMYPFLSRDEYKAAHYVP